MKKLYISLGCAFLLQMTNILSAQVLLNENFGTATGTTPPVGWTNNEIYADGGVWMFNNPYFRSPSSPITAPFALFDSEYQATFGEEAALESSVFDASATSDYILASFDQYFDGDYGGECFVEVWNGSVWVQVYYNDETTSSNDHQTINITTAVNAASDAQIRFRWVGTYNLFWIVDNVKIETVTCAPITNLASNGATLNSIDITWDAGGAETNWNIEYGPVGFTPGSGTPGTSITESFTATPLLAETSYDFYVQADCGGGDESVWSGPIIVITGYCGATGNDSDYYINNFSTTGGATSNISNLNSGSSGYEDATSMSVSQFAGGPSINFHTNLEGGTFGLGIWVDWNNDLSFDGSEQMFISNGYDDEYSGSFGVPPGTSIGNYRMRVLVDYYDTEPSDPCSIASGLGEVEDYTFEVVPTPSCLPVTDLQESNETTTSIDLEWTAGGGESFWNIEWGALGFVPGTGAGADSAQFNDVIYTINGLDPSTTYDIYVQANCGSDSSFWTLVTGTTLCAPITSLPWTENFDAMPSVDFGLFPNCWFGESNDWLTDNDATGYTFGTAPYSGDNFLAIRYNCNDYIWTPEFELTEDGNYEFSFMWAGDGNSGWDGEAFVNDEQSSTGATSLGDLFVVSSDSYNTNYRKVTYCFSPTSTGVYAFALHVSAGFSPNNITFDDFSLIERGETAGANGSSSVCQTEGLVDLNDIITQDDENGVWTFAPNPATIESGNMFNPQYVPAGTVQVKYITSGCLEDTAIANITIYGPSLAGDDGSIAACKNEPIDLLSGLNGTVNLGGDWYDPTTAMLPTSQVTTGQFPGSFNYSYITGNGVCPDDSSLVIVNVGNCDWLSIEESVLDGVTVYPNPSTGLIYIETSFSSGTYNLVITDVNGRVIQTGTDSIKTGTNTIDLEHAETGIYFFTISSNNAEKVYRVVIQ